MNRDLHAFLRAAGATEADIERAARDGRLPLLVLDRILLPDVPEYDAAALAVATGLDEQLLLRFWRALGFADLPEGATSFTARDLAAARLLAERLAVADVAPESFVQQIQAVSAAMARIAIVEAEALLELVARLGETGLTSEEVALTLAELVRWEDLSALIDYEHRMQLRAALWVRGALAATPDLPIGVGFADLAGFTATSARLEVDELAELVTRWDAEAFDTVSAGGGRVVKTIGDEVMFVALPDRAAEIALALRDLGREGNGLLPVRVGVAAGPVVPHAGDVYGPVVNLAHRLAELADPDTALAPSDLRAALGDDRFRWTDLGSRRLRGIGEVGIVRLEGAR